MIAEKQTKNKIAVIDTEFVVFNCCSFGRCKGKKSHYKVGGGTTSLKWNTVIYRRVAVIKASVNYEMGKFENIESYSSMIKMKRGLSVLTEKQQKTWRSSKKIHGLNWSTRDGKKFNEVYKEVTSFIFDVGSIYAQGTWFKSRFLNRIGVEWKPNTAKRKHSKYFLFELNYFRVGEFGKFLKYSDWMKQKGDENHIHDLMEECKYLLGELEWRMFPKYEEQTKKDNDDDDIVDVEKLKDDFIRCVKELEKRDKIIDSLIKRLKRNGKNTNKYVKQQEECNKSTLYYKCVVYSLDD